MFFKRSRNIIKKQPIEIALNMLMHTMIIAYGYMHNKRYKLTEHDLKMMDLFKDELWRNYCTAQWIASCLHQRSRGEPEGSPKFTDPESFDYHFPK